MNYDKDVYTFNMIQSDGTVVIIKGGKVGIDDILEDFKSFLKGCTFSDELVDAIYRNGSEGREYNGN